MLSKKRILFFCFCCIPLLLFKFTCNLVQLYGCTCTQGLMLVLNALMSSQYCACILLFFVALLDLKMALHTKGSNDVGEDTNPSLHIYIYIYIHLHICIYNRMYGRKKMHTYIQYVYLRNSI